MTESAAAYPAAGTYYDHEPEYRRRRAKGHRGWDRVFDPCELQIFVAEKLLRPGDRVLELGTGGGQAALFAARLGCTVAACDASPTSIEMARENLRDEAPEVQRRVEFVLADLLTGPRFAAAPFDVVLDIHCLHGMVLAEHRQQFLRLAKSWLRPGGLLLSANMCGLPHTEALLATVDVPRRISHDGHRYFAEEDEVRDELAAAELEIVYWNRRQDPDDVDYLLFAARRAGA